MSNLFCSYLNIYKSNSSTLRFLLIRILLYHTNIHTDILDMQSKFPPIFQKSFLLGGMHSPETKLKIGPTGIRMSTGWKSPAPGAPVCTASTVSGEIRSSVAPTCKQGAQLCHICLNYLLTSLFPMMLLHMQKKSKFLKYFVIFLIKYAIGNLRNDVLLCCSIVASHVK